MVQWNCVTVTVACGNVFLFLHFAWIMKLGPIPWNLANKMKTQCCWVNEVVATNWFYFFFFLAFVFTSMRMLKTQVHFYEAKWFHLRELVQKSNFIVIESIILIEYYSMSGISKFYWNELKCVNKMEFCSIVCHENYKRKKKRINEEPLKIALNLFFSFSLFIFLIKLFF